MTRGERIWQGLRRKGWSSTYLAELLGIEQGTITKTLTGARPGDKHMPRIAELLECPVEWLTVGDNPPAWAEPLTPPVKSSGESRGLPVIGTVSAGDGDVGPSDWIDSPQQPIYWPAGWVAVKIHGDSAYPVAYSGQLAVVDSDRKIDPATATRDEMGDLHDNIVLVHTRENGEVCAYLKRFCVDDRAPDGFVFASVNAGRSSPYLPAAIITSVAPVVAFILEDPRQPRVKGRNKASRHV